MQISFFEEYPTKKNLQKLKLIKFPTKIYLAAKSVKDFKKIKISSKYVKEKIYWPVLEKKEGYWFSPFTDRAALLRTINDIGKQRIPVMLDAELPTHPNPLLYFTQTHNFFRNRKIIRNFVSNRKNIYTAEYFPSSRLAESLFHFLGLSFKNENHYPIKMIYSSMHDFGEPYTRKLIQRSQKRYGKRLRLALGTLGKGILGNEPQLSNSLLKRDLFLAKELGIQEIILFRLGGLQKKHVEIIETIK